MKHVGLRGNAKDILCRDQLTLGAAVLSNNAVATTETIVAQWSVAALALVAGDVLNIGNMGQVSSTATLTFRIRMGTAGTTADPLLCTFSTTAAGVVNGHQSLDALIAILSATTATASGDVRLGNGRLGLSAAAFAAAAVNLTVANFISITLVQSIAQTYTSRAAMLSF